MAAALLLLNNLGIGGSERKSVRIANALRQAGHDIHLAYLNAPHTLRGSFDPALPVLHLDRAGKFSLPALRRLKHYAVEQRISHVACVNLYPLLYAQAVAWQLGKRAPVVSALINTTDFRTRRDERQMMLYAPLLRRASHRVFGCGSQQEQWIDRYHLPAANSRVIYNGVDHAHFNPAAVAETREHLRRRYGFPLDAFIVITVGQLRPEKQQTDLIQAVAALARRGLPVHALLVGDGDERGAIERCIADLGVRHTVHLAGAAEMVEVGQNGFLYSPGDVMQLAGHIAALAGEQVLTRNMGQAAMTRVQRWFGFTQMVDEYRALLFPAESHAMPGAELERSHGNPKLTASRSALTFSRKHQECSRSE